MRQAIKKCCYYFPAILAVWLIGFLCGIWLLVVLL